MHIDFNTIKDGDSEALVAIYKAYREDFLKWSWNTYKLSREDAKDIFQDSVIAFYNNIIEERITELTCDSRTYLFTIAKFKAINFIKRSSRNINLSMPQLINDYNSTEDMADKKDNDEHIRETLKEHLNLLSDKERRILEMYYFEDKSMKEIAAQLGYKNENVAKKMKFESFKKLAQLIKGKMMLLIL